MEATTPATREQKPGSPLESTLVLVSRAQAGDRAALEQLAARYLPALQRFAHGRLPTHARRLCDTSDLIQDTVLRALGRVDSFRSRGQGSFLGWLRAILINRLTDVVRSAAASPGHQPLGDSLPVDERSPLDEVVSRDELAVFEAALSRLTSAKQEAVMLFVEMQCSYAEIARILGKPSANAARMTVQRGIDDLATEMRRVKGNG